MRNSFTAKDAEVAKEQKSFTAKDAKDAKEIIIRSKPQGREDNAKGVIGYARGRDPSF